MKLSSWNVNGIRAAWSKGLKKYLEDEAPDVFCLQEVKIQFKDLTEELKNPFGYSSEWVHAEKAGYSGLGVYFRKEPQSISLGIGFPEADREARVMTLEFNDIFVVNAYFPNSQRDHARLPFKLEFCKKMQGHLDGLRKKGKNVVVCGDFNIAHKEIDLKNPKTNKDNAGFLPEERAWMDDFLSNGYVDSFRKFEAGPDHYTWWSYRPGVREKNIGWRLDYHCVNEDLADRLESAAIRAKVFGSDHCPIILKVAD